MKLMPDDGKGRGRLRSDGKLLEVMPVISDACGQPFMLPPVVYRVPNWLLGMEDYDVRSMPMTFFGSGKDYVPGTRTNASHSIQFMVRILEDSPDCGITVADVDADAVVALIDAIKEAQHNVRPPR